MFDPNLIESIHRWEYEGGRIVHRDLLNRQEFAEREMAFSDWNDSTQQWLQEHVPSSRHVM